MVIELPLSLPNIMLGLSLMLMFASVPGKFLSAHGFPVIFSVNGIVMAHLMINLPFVIRMIKTAFMNVDPRLEWIAGSLGATPVKRFFTVTLPLAKNSIIGAGILAWSRRAGRIRSDADAGRRYADEDGDTALQHLSQHGYRRHRAGHGLGFDSPSDLSAVAFSVCAAG